MNNDIVKNLNEKEKQELLGTLMGRFEYSYDKRERVLNGINAYIAKYGTILGETVRKRGLVAVKFLLTMKGIDVYKVNDEGQTPLEVIIYGSTFCHTSDKIAKLLLEHIANLNLSSWQ
ncbi:unnamed protein product, partial [marine sediment metagenome]